jgi:hypothetical protein
LKHPVDVRQVVSDVTDYAESWKVWWIGCQPTARVGGSWPLPRESRPDIEWGKLLNGGKYGVFLFVMALSWWAASLDPAVSSPELAEAINDLNWVVCQLKASFTIPPSLSAPSAASEVQDASRGKRKVKLTEKAMDGGERMQKRFCR